ncbi:hypothetical protein AWC29_13475 [Mycobacterium triplex]|uniref:Uncharacterized protein n=1 Tax=Mycobacterium triplex TaxID=47839 RepID=A0A024K0F3_9MYCO|nr:hypothetical protein [Mycobacterium triplex]ORX04897.1 hypothetical protein AWC29_13475 [Mycobacterium triplex]CDO89540.1 hypothetical protein BN973_03917 [Mycobacterium triplex]
MTDYPAVVTVRVTGVLSNYLTSLEVFIDELRRNGTDGEISYRPPGGKGPTTLEVIGLYIALKAADASISTVVSTTMNAAINWIKAPFRRASEEIPTEPVLKMITIYGPDGKPLKQIKGSGADDIEVKDLDESS